MLDVGFEIACGDINLLVGCQGCGKSSLLNLIQKNHSDLEVEVSDFVKVNGVSTFFFDSERDNPRVKDPQMFSNSEGEDVGIGVGGALYSRFRSHGEVLQDFVINPLLKAKDCVILLDEPESGLSITNQLRFIDLVKAAVANGCQFFIATHCYPLIEAFDVISLEHRKQMRGVDFISLLKSGMV